MSTREEIVAQVEATHPPGSQRLAAARAALADLFSALEELRKFGHALEAVWGTFAAAPQEWPKMVYSETGMQSVSSQAQLDSLEGTWGTVPPVVLPGKSNPAASFPEAQNPHAQVIRGHEPAMPGRTSAEALASAKEAGGAAFAAGAGVESCPEGLPDATAAWKQGFLEASSEAQRASLVVQPPPGAEPAIGQAATPVPSILKSEENVRTGKTPA